MRKLAALTCACLLAGLSCRAAARVDVPAYEDLPRLTPENRHLTACSRIGGYFIRQHYKIFNVDDAFADKVIDRYLSYLDYGRSLYTQSEVSGIYGSRARVLDAINHCALDYPFQLYNEALRKRYLKYAYFLEALNGELDLDGDDSIAYDRSGSPFPATAEALRQLWSAELKNEYINQILNDKTDEQARNRIRRRYEAALGRLAQTESEDAFSAFENAFATAIDPHTNYLGPEASEDFNDDINLSLEGIGAVLSQEDEYTEIRSILPGSPAERSKKLKAGDRVIGVRQQNGAYDDIIGWRLTDVVKKIKGPKGTAVFLDIERGEGANAKSFIVRLERDKIRLQDREARGEVKLSADGTPIGVLTISSFYTDLHLDVEREIGKLKRENVSGIVVDLRNNGGGLLPEAVNTTGLFIRQGPVVLVRDVQGNEAPYEDADPGIAYEGPLVVLINRLSASSSEIMAAALKDYGRALIVGDTTYGKGTVQQNRPLNRLYDLSSERMGSIHYTIAKFYRINGDSTQLRGVEPDIALPGLVDNSEFGERTKPNALVWDRIAPAEYERYFNIEAALPELSRACQERARDNVEFKILDDETRRYQKLKREGVISVNLEKRRESAREEDAIRLKETNIRLRLMGREPVARLKDLPDDFEFDDPILNETLNIAADLTREFREEQPRSVPFLRRFTPLTQAQ